MFQIKKVNLQKYSFLVPWLALVVSIFAGYYAWSGNDIAKRSNKIALESNAISNETKKSIENLFLVEKRPYIDVQIPQVSKDSYLDIKEADDIEATFSVELKNNGAIPARSVETIIYFVDNNLVTYNTFELSIPESQKIFPGKSLQFSITTGDKKDTSIADAIELGEFRILVFINYRSDVDQSIIYTTKKQFLVKKEGTTWFINTGTFD